MAARRIVHLRDISSTQWKSGLAAWLGWFFDGLDMHLYTLVATPFVAQLLDASSARRCGRGNKSSWIQAAFLVGWALGGGFFGRIGDRLGRSRALDAYDSHVCMFTGLSFFAQAWWHLMIFRFLAALGIGGEWAVGASLLSETWPARWRHWIAAVLQSGVNLGVLLATLAGYVILTLLQLPDRVGVSGRDFAGTVGALDSPRGARAGRVARGQSNGRTTSSRGSSSCFKGRVRRITIAAILVCATSLTAHWAFMFWFLQHLRNLPEVASWSDADKEPIGEREVGAGDGRVDRRQFLGGGDCAADRLSAGGCRDVPGVFRDDVFHV